VRTRVLGWPILLVLCACGDSSTCDAVVGSKSTVDCHNTGTCKLEVGEGSTVDCHESTSCGGKTRVCGDAVC
jgi:hypothetical protein